MRNSGGLYRQKDSQFWWMRYSLRGRQYRESTKVLAVEASEREAQKVLRRRLQEVGADLIGARKFVTPQTEKITVGRILDDLVDDLKVRDKYLAPTRSHIKAVRAQFGERPAIGVTDADVRKYIQRCLDAEMAKATVNRRLQLLGQAYGLAGIDGPKIPKLSEADNVRQGFLDPADFELFVIHLPDDIQDFARWAYWTGWRKGTIVRLEWTMFDMRAMTMNVPGKIIKNREPLKVPLEGILAEIISRRYEKRSYKRPDGTTAISKLVFYRESERYLGSPVADIDKAWKTACDATGGLKVLLHDFRRSAVRNLTRRGVPEQMAMRITGHKTRAIFARYNIIDERDLSAAMKTYLGETTAESSNLLRFTRKGDPE